MVRKFRLRDSQTHQITFDTPRYFLNSSILLGHLSGPPPQLFQYRLDGIQFFFCKSSISKGIQVIIQLRYRAGAN